MMSDIERARAKREDGSGPWEVCKIMCLVCQATHVSVHPLYQRNGELVNLNTLQCPNCKECMSEVLPMPTDPSPP
jgi:hypothetical protein